MIPLEKLDLRRIEKLENLNNIGTFWDDVRKLTRRVRSDHSIGRWQCLAEQRFAELENGKYQEV